MGTSPFGKDNAAGTYTVTTSFTLSGEPRTVRDDVLTAMDDALGALAAPGTEVLHAIDPRRILAFEEGGPAVWSVGVVEVPGERSYRLVSWA
jgi:hypothetical protein